jgi:hypothetical protein
MVQLSQDEREEGDVVRGVAGEAAASWMVITRNRYSYNLKAGLIRPRKVLRIIA